MACPPNWGYLTVWHINCPPAYAQTIWGVCNNPAPPVVDCAAKGIVPGVILPAPAYEQLPPPKDVTRRQLFFASDR